MKILIDNGHGEETPGKCSPDGALREYAWARETAKGMEEILKGKGYDAERIVPEEADVSLGERCRRVNAFCAKHGASNVVLISVHVNAAGADGEWHSARGWSVWVAPNASVKSKVLARLLYDEADKAGLRGNRAVPDCKYWLGNFAIVRDTKCAAVLTENLFQDNREDVAYLCSAAGKDAIVNLHVEAVTRFVRDRAR